LDADVAEAVDMRADMALTEIGVFHIAQLVVSIFSARRDGDLVRMVLLKRVPNSGMPSTRLLAMWR
jgi:hypothetical protein